MSHDFDFYLFYLENANSNIYKFQYVRSFICLINNVQVRIEYQNKPINIVKHVSTCIRLLRYSCHKTKLSCDK